jgi:transcriptional regulator with XRE-family HTH domain
MMNVATRQEEIEFTPADIRGLRRDLGWSVRRMASEIGIAPATLSHWMIEATGPDGSPQSGHRRPGRLALRALQSLREALNSGQIERGDEYSTKRRRAEIDRDRLRVMVERVESRKNPPETMEQLCRSIAQSKWGKKNNMYETLIRARIAEQGIRTKVAGGKGEQS